jgi:hypothetical protein
MKGLSWRSGSISVDRVSRDELRHIDTGGLHHEQARCTASLIDDKAVQSESGLPKSSDQKSRHDVVRGSIHTYG